MSMVELHPEDLSISGKQYVMLPRGEFESLQEFLEEIKDMLALNDARAKEGHEPSLSWEEVKKEFGFRDE